MPKKQNSRFAKELGDIDPPWVRVEDFARLKIKHPVVIINGTFDILHSGHIKLVAHARKHGKTVVVAIDSDALVGTKKPGRPYLSWIERAVAFRFLPVDYIVEIESDGDFKRLVELSKPDLRVRGAEYADKPSRIPDIPSLYIHDIGIHSSELVRRIINKYNFNNMASSEGNAGGVGRAQNRDGLGNRHIRTVYRAAVGKGIETGSTDSESGFVGRDESNGA
jgi:cytidyltransferase-like protein